jgi:glycosidase
VNLETLVGHRGIIANPNCVAILACVAIAPLQRRFGLRRLQIATYQAASGAGQPAMEELAASTRAHLAGEAYPPQAFYALMNLLSSHDQARALHVFGWHDDTRDPAVIERAKQRLRLAVLFQMVFPGAPTVYYGDEVGVTGGDDPYNRATYPWADLGGQPDTALLAEFKKLIRMRHDHAVLRRGSIDAPVFLDDHVVVLVRRLGEQWAITATNNASTARTVSLPLPAGLPLGVMQDALGGEPVQASAQGLRFEVPALYGRVLVSGGSAPGAGAGGRP